MSVQAVEGYEPEGLGPIDGEMLALIPFKPGDRVAFPDRLEGPGALADAQYWKTVEARHPEHPYAGSYGIVKAIGYGNGGIRLDVLVFAKETGVQETDTTIYRATLGEFQ